jgi:hypothetical protein
MKSGVDNNAEIVEQNKKGKSVESPVEYIPESHGHITFLRARFKRS